MYHSKLIDIISVFDKKQFKLLSKFIYSPVFNQHKDVTALFKYIYTLDKFTEENLDKKLVYSILFPKAKYDDLRLRHVVSYFLKVCEDCLAYMEMNSHEDNYRLNLLRAFRKHDLDKHFRNDFLVLKKTAKEEINHFPTNYLISSQINAEAFETYLSIHVVELSYLNESDKALDLYYLLSKLKTACKMLIHEAKQPITNPEFVEKLLADFKLEHLELFPVVETYYWAFMAFQNTAKMEYFKHFKENLAKNSNAIEMEELKSLFALAILFCKKKLRENNFNFERELFEIYLHGLASEALLKNQRISFDTQKSIVDIGLHLNELHWVEDFIRDSKQITNKKYREELFQLNTAKVQFAKSNFELCLTILDAENIKSSELIIEALELKIKALQQLNESGKQKTETQLLKKIKLKYKGRLKMS